MSLVATLQPFMAPRTARRRGRACELCDASLDAEHPHLADVERKALACACRGCALLFTRPVASGGRWRTLPERYLFDPYFTLRGEQWETLGIPVGVAFFFKSAASRHPDHGAVGWTAIYPSPAGPVESLLPLDLWSAIASRTPLSDVLEPEVEALLVTAIAAGEYECTLVPIHACYALVGRVRRLWRGLDGGEEARVAISEQLGRLRARRTPVDGGHR